MKPLESLPPLTETWVTKLFFVHVEKGWYHREVGVYPTEEEAVSNMPTPDFYCVPVEVNGHYHNDKLIGYSHRGKMGTQTPVFTMPGV